MKNVVPHLSKTELVQYLKLKGFWSPTVRKALAQAQKSHHIQKRDDDGKYLEQHIYPITLDLVQNVDTQNLEVLIVSALLHDAIEDDPNFTAEICEQEFGKQIAEIVLLLTKPPKDNQHSYDEMEKLERNKRHLERIKNGSQIAKLVKLADRLNNLRCSIVLKRQPKHARYILETEEIFLPFAEEVSEYYFAELHQALKMVR